MGLLRFHPIFAVLAVAFLLSSCFSGLGTGVKTLGTATSGSTYDPTLDQDAFSIKFAYKPAGSTTVSIQGLLGNSATALSKNCGITGANCTCTFYKATNNTATVGTTAISLSVENNSLTCNMNSASPDDYKYVVLQTLDGKKSTGQISFTTTLGIQDVIGALDKKNVRGIYRYSCTRTFIEGTNVSPPSNVQCAADQNLGFIHADYSYYLYNSQNGGTLDKQTNVLPYDNNSIPGVCGYQREVQAQCQGSPALQYALYATASAPFLVPVNLSTNPNVNPTTLGYAAIPDSSGNCPTGLMKIRPFYAQPASIVKGSIDNYNPPSTFVNINGSLNSTVVQPVPASGTLSETFTVNRIPNQVQACNFGTTGNSCNTPEAILQVSGSDQHLSGACAHVANSANYYACDAILLLASRTVQTVAYIPMTPVVCAIPADLVSGMF